ncbi:MAG: hypothetical protein K0R51_68 [Cytophagaceae bacterium]|nr:hypothetical protein [Cytophagaceae bacterium]
MKNGICIVIGVLLLTLAFFTENTLLGVGGFTLILLNLLSRIAISSGVEYNESHYRIYTRILFWKKGHWQSIVRVRKIYIRHYACMQRQYFSPLRGAEELHEPLMEYQVYFVRKSGYYKIFETACLDTARHKADELGRRYNLVVEEKTKQIA